MAERGIDISNEFPKPWTDETIRAADVVITMGCRDVCPIFPGKRYESWDDLDDPAGLDTEAVRPTAQLPDELGQYRHRIVLAGGDMAESPVRRVRRQITERPWREQIRL